ncbi:O-acetylhomoserine aminocarboxypropyltransferase/cysteine synthase [Candidatus Bathyarchaeota archaeon]|nr:O-acetylhomoserine aminocarboxypropyltransferase/cysteine synthase [Candidatus Bathyarchaeota archaeon]
MADRKYRFDTIIVHSGIQPENWLGSTLPPIFQTASHRVATAEGLSDLFAGKEKGFIYQRLHNPTNQALENRIAQLEGGVGAIVTSSGMAAIHNSLTAIAKNGDEVISGNSLFMSTYLLFANVFRRFGIDVKFVESTDIDEFERSITPRTKAIFVESVGNPKMDVPDIERLAAIAHKNDVPLVVDNTMPTPYLLNPFNLGADIVVHSTTKYLSGHGDALGGVIVDSGNFPWPNEKFPDFEVSKERADKKAYLDKVWREIHINVGATQSPFHSYLTMLGIDTLAVRMERHVVNTDKIVRFMTEHRKVKWVNHPSLKSSPSYGVAKKQFSKGCCALFTFGLADQRECFDFIRNLKLVYHLANLGDCKTLAIHPYSSQYVSFDPATRMRLGITPGMIRVSVGIEDAEDIIEDFDQALNKL